MKMKFLVAAVVGTLILPWTGRAAWMTVDEILFDPDTVSNPASLSGTVGMTFSGSTLTINLANTSGTAGVAAGAGGILSGVGFSLPTGMDIASGTVFVDSGSFAGLNISDQWGYRNGPINGGHFVDPGVLSYNTAVSTLTPDRSVNFDGSTGQIDGPDFGLISPLGNNGGVFAFRNSVEITLLLSGSYGGNLLQFIQDNPVGLTFSSPKTGGTTVPDGGVTVALMGFSVALLGFIRRKVS